MTFQCSYEPLFYKCGQLWRLAQHLSCMPVYDAAMQRLTATAGGICKRYMYILMCTCYWHSILVCTIHGAWTAYHLVINVMHE